MDNYYSPQYSNGGLNSAIGGSYSQPPVEQPKVGDKMLLMINSYGAIILGQGNNIPIGSEIIEVEVLSVKKGKVVLE